MRELYIEGVAIHGGPEPCAVVRKGGGEASVGVRAGWAIEPRKDKSDRGADALTTGGRQHRWRRYRESSADLAGSENLCMCGISMRENREIPRSPARLDGGAGRAGKAQAVIP
jgi:hypothetical protein